MYKVAEGCAENDKIKALQERLGASLSLAGAYSSEEETPPF